MFSPFLGIIAALRPSSHFFDNFFMGIEVCLERCDSYGKFGYIKNKLQQSWSMMLHENVKEFSVKIVIPAFQNPLSLTLFALWFMLLYIIPNTLSHVPYALCLMPYNQSLILNP